jgi:hypothetical protein
MMFSNSIHLLENDKISFFFMAESNSIAYKCHIFLIHSSVVAHLGCFHNLAIVNSAAINVGVQVPLGIPPGVGILHHMADLCLDFYETSKFKYRMVALACIPNSSV